MGLTQAFRNHLVTAAAGGVVTAFNTANAHIGVGDSATAFASSQTDLQAATNKLRRPMAAGYPTVAANVLTFRAVFAPGEANHAWAEWAVFNGASGATMLNRKVEALGTKTSAQAWEITVTLTLAVS